MVLVAPLAEARAWVGIGPGRTRGAVEGGRPGTGPAGVMEAGGMRRGAVARGNAGVLALSLPRSGASFKVAVRAGPERRRSARVSLDHPVLTACEPWGTDSDGAKLIACAFGVLTACARVLTCD
jgi:hypothetical protein